MRQKLEEIRERAAQALESATDLASVEELRVKFLGKKGELTAILKQMGGVAPEERPVLGQLANEARGYIEQIIAKKNEELQSAALANRLLEEKIDVTAPSKRRKLGNKHPLTIVLDEIKEIFIVFLHFIT